MNVNIKKTNDETIFEISGRLDTTTAPSFSAVVNEQGEALTNLVLDMKQLSYISSAGLRVLLTTQKRMNVQGSMKLINVNEAVMDVLEMTGFADILVIE